MKKKLKKLIKKLKKNNKKTISGFPVGTANMKKHPKLKSRLHSQLLKALTVNLGKNTSILMETADSLSLHLEKIDSSGGLTKQIEGMLEPDTLKSILASQEDSNQNGNTDKESKANDNEKSLSEITISLDNVKDLDALNKELESLSKAYPNTNINFIGKGLDGNKAADFFQFMNSQLKIRQPIDNYASMIDTFKETGLVQLSERDSAMIDELSEAMKKAQKASDSNEGYRELVDFDSSELIKKFLEIAIETQGGKNKKTLQKLNLILTQQSMETLRQMPQKIKELEPFISEQNEKLANLPEDKDDQKLQDFNKEIKEIDEASPTEGDNKSGSYWMKDQNGNNIGIFKPESQEGGALNDRAPRGAGAVREMLAYSIDRYLKLGIVPPTRLLVHGHEAYPNKELTLPQGKLHAPGSKVGIQVGSIQKAAENVKGDLGEYQNDENIKAGKFDVITLQLMALLDIILLNVDRHGDNALYNNNGELIPIDHGEIIPDAGRFFDRFIGISTASAWAWADLKEANELFTDEIKEKVRDLNINDLIYSIEKTAESASKEMNNLLGEGTTSANIDPAMLSMLKFSMEALKQAVKADLTPAQIETIYKERSEGRNETVKKTGKEDGGGEFFNFIRGTFNKDYIDKKTGQTPADELHDRDNQKTVDEFNRNMEKAFNRLNKEWSPLVVSNPEEAIAQDKE